MKTKLLLTEVAFFITLTIFLPTFSLAQGAWIRKSDFPGGTRYNVACFSIGTKAYIGIGYNDADFPSRDFWEWDQAANVWSKKADYPGNSTGLAVSFSIGSKGYIGTGNNFSSNGSTNEFWEYDPAADIWTQKASLPTIPSRNLAVGFSIGSKGYIGLGLQQTDGGGGFYYYQDFWEWDQATDVWTKKSDFPGNTRIEAIGFSIGNKGYIGMGWDYIDYSGNIPLRDFWEWDQATNVWTRKADFAGNARSGAFSFSIGNKGYIGLGLGSDGTTYYQDFWEWDQAANIWTEKTDFGGTARLDAVGFSIGNKGYIGTGLTGVNPNYAFQDLWEYDPIETTGTPELVNENSTVSPNPGNGRFSISSSSPITAIEVYNLLGDKIYSDFSPKQQTPKEIDLSNAPKGIYVVKIYNGTKSLNRKVVVQ